MEQPDFDRAVEMLLIKHHEKSDPKWVVTAFDGRGGDGGRDVEVRDELGELKVLYQLKCFPEGFSGGWAKSRRPQVRKSYASGVKLGPGAWKLVIPGNPTVGEHKFVTDLRGTSEPKTSIVGRAQLDAWISEFPLLLAALTRDPAVTVLRALQAEHLDLSMSGNVTAAALNFASRMSGTSVYWGRRVTIAEEEVVHELYPRRPDAAVREPLQLTIEVNRNADTKRLSAWRELVDFGGPEASLEPEDIFRIRRSGPTWFEGEETDVGVQVGSPKTVPRATELRAIAADGSAIGTVTGLSSMYAPGVSGVRIDADFPGGFGVQLLVPHEATGESTVRLNLRPVGHDARDVHACMAFRHATLTASRIEMWVSGRLLTTMGWPNQDDEAFDPFMEQLVSDLNMVARYAQQRIDVPDSISSRDRREIRRCRLLLDGRCIVEPAFSGVTGTLSGSLDPETERLLSETTGAMRVQTPLVYDVLGHPIRIDDLAMVLTQVVAENGAEAIEALRATTASTEVRFKSLNRPHPLVYSPSRYSADPEMPLLPTALEIPGYDELFATSPNTSSHP